jgi:hypothetical protein
MMTRWYAQFRLSNLLVLITIGFQWSINWHENRNCAQHLCNGELWRLISSCRKHMCFQWCRELIKRRRSAQHQSALLERCNRRCNGEQWLLISSGTKHMCFQWWRELSKRQRSTFQFCAILLVVCVSTREVRLPAVSHLRRCFFLHLRVLCPLFRTSDAVFSQRAASEVMNSTDVWLILGENVCVFYGGEN